MLKVWSGQRSARPPRWFCGRCSRRRHVRRSGQRYHFGGCFLDGPHRTPTTTDPMGRLEGWDNIHLIDASVFPSVPATTFTLTIMANAHRIATETRGVTA